MFSLKSPYSPFFWDTLYIYIYVSYVDTHMLYDIDKKYMCIVKDKKSKKKLSRFLLSKCPCRDFVRVEILSVSRFCLCRDFVRVEILSCRDFVLSRFCLVEILSVSRFCPCRDFVCVEILSVSRFCLSRFCPSTVFSYVLKII